MKEQSIDIPQSVSYEGGSGYTTVLIRINIEKHTKREGEYTETYYICDLTRFTIPDTELTLELKTAIEADPEKYSHYIPVQDRPTLQQKYTDAIQKWMDDTAHTHGYDDIFTAISYADSSVPKFKTEGQACKLWRDKVWVECYDYLDKVLSGEVELIPIEELITKLPQIEW